MAFFFKDVYDLEGKGFSSNFAERQYQFERRQLALRVHNSGISFREIGEKLGVTRERVLQMCKHAERDNRHDRRGPLGFVLDDTGIIDFNIDKPGWLDEEERERILTQRNVRRAKEEEKRRIKAEKDRAMAEKDRANRERQWRANVMQRVGPEWSPAPPIDPDKLANYRRHFPHLFDDY